MALGEILRNARVQKGLTPLDVAENTRMLVQIVECLEREDFRRIAAPIYGRGFIKLYAELLELDPEPLIRDFMELYDGARVPAVKTKKPEPLAEPAPAAAPVPVKRTVSGQVPVSPQRQPVLPRPAVRPLTVSEETPPVAGKPVLKGEAPVPSPEPASAQAAMSSRPEKVAAGNVFVVEPEEPYAESDEPDLFHSKPPRHQPEEAASKRAEGAVPKLARGAQKHPIFNIGECSGKPLKQEPCEDGALARMQTVGRKCLDWIEDMKDGVSRNLPGILSRKQSWAVGGAGLLLLVCMVFGVRVLFRMTGSNVQEAPSAVIDHVAPPPNLYVD